VELNRHTHASSVQRRDNFAPPQNLCPAVYSALPQSWPGKLITIYVQTAPLALIMYTNDIFSVLRGVDVDLSFSFGFFRRILKLLIAGVSKEPPSS